MRAYTTVLLDGNNMTLLINVCLGKMSTSYRHYSPQEIQSILEEHEPGVRGKGLKALAKRHNIKGDNLQNGMVLSNRLKAEITVLS